MTVNVSNETIVLLAGQQQKRSLPGAQIICYQSTGEVQISLDDRGWLPFSRGIELNAPNGVFETLYFKNTSAQAITIEIAVVSDTNVFIDRRELAAQVAVEGGLGVYVVNSPFESEGGSVQQIGYSAHNVQYNNSAETTEFMRDEIVSKAENVNGVTIRFIELIISSNSLGFPAYFTFNYPYAGAVLYRTNVDIHGHYKSFYIQKGRSFSVNVGPGTVARAVINYDIH